MLDTGPHVGQAQSDNKSFLQQSIECMNLILQRKIFSQSKDEVALVLFGTDETDNLLSQNDEEYQNIVVKRELAVVNWDFMTLVQEDVKAGNAAGDFIDAMIVAMDHLQEQMGGRKFVGQQIYLMTNFKGVASTHQLDVIIKGMQNSGIQLNVIGPDLENTDYTSKLYSGKQKFNEAVIKRILKALGGESFTFDEAVPMLSFFKKRNIRSVPWKVDLELGDSLKIPVNCYIKIRQFVPKTFKKSYGQDSEAKLLNETSYHKKDIAQTECEKEETVAGYRYGKTLVPFSEEDKANMAYESLGNSSKSFTILAFSKQDCIKRHHFLGNGVSVVVADKAAPGASVALSAFIHALYETNMVAIVRQVYRNKCNPKIGFLAPEIEHDHECLVLIHLPFMEDWRRYTFSPLSADTKNAPSDEQLSAVDELITAMNLDAKHSSDQEILKIGHVCNPYIQRLYQCILHRGLHPNDPLPSVNDTILKQFEPSKEILDACHSVSKRLKDLFPLKVVSTKKQKKTGQDTFQDGKNPDKPPVNLDKLNDDEDFLGQSMSAFARGKVTEIGTTNPNKDFLMLIKDNPNDLLNAGIQLQKVILNLVMNSYGNLACQENYNKALECLKTLRQEFVQTLPNEFNKFMEDFKKDLLSKGKIEFWEKLKCAQVGLISNRESSLSSITNGEETVFFTTVNEKQPSPPSSPHSEDVDDLLDEL